MLEQHENIKGKTGNESLNMRFFWEVAKEHSSRKLTVVSGKSDSGSSVVSSVNKKDAKHC